MDWDGFKTMLFANGILPEAVDACKEFVLEEMTWQGSSAHKKSTSNDLGYAECGDITTIDQAIEVLKHSQWMATFDDTARKRQRAEEKFINDPGKHFKRKVLKAYWLVN
jgi:hypothetical protein